jgi:hypothetical protein
MASVHEEIFLEEKEKSEGDLKTFLRLWVYIKKYKLLLFFLTLTVGKGIFSKQSGRKRV